MKDTSLRPPALVPGRESLPFPGLRPVSRLRRTGQSRFCFASAGQTKTNQKPVSYLFVFTTRNTVACPSAYSTIKRYKPSGKAGCKTAVLCPSSS